MQLTENWHYRARSYFLKKKEAHKMCFSAEPRSNEDATFRKQIQSGYMPKECENHFADFIEGIKNNQEIVGGNSELTFTELMSDSTYFVMNPDKVLGEEVVSSSIHFPIQVKGTKEEVIEKIRESLVATDKTKRIRIAKVKAKALKLKRQRLKSA